MTPWSVWLLMWFLIFQDAPPGILEFLEPHHFRYTWFCCYTLQNGWIRQITIPLACLRVSCLNNVINTWCSQPYFFFFFNFSPVFLLFFLIPQYLFHIKLVLLIINRLILLYSSFPLLFVTAHISRTNISCKIGKQVKPQVNLLPHRNNLDFIISFIGVLLIR